MKQLLWIGLLASATSADTALSSFEYLGDGVCAVTAGCSSWDCTNTYFWRDTDSQYRATNTETCAQDALDAGARGFTVRADSSFTRCLLHPQQDPGLENSSDCPQSGCPARSPFGKAFGLYDWRFKNPGRASPILSIYPTSLHSCYRRTGPAPSENPTENPTEAPTENPTKNPTEVPTENPTENHTEVCCKEINAECLSGLIGVTELKFCDAFPGTLGCTAACCKAFHAECLSCQLGLTVEEFCIENSSTPGCTLVDPCREYRHKGSCRKQRNCIWKKVDKKCMTG